MDKILEKIHRPKKPGSSSTQTMAPVNMVVWEKSGCSPHTTEWRVRGGEAVFLPGKPSPLSSSLSQQGQVEVARKALNNVVLPTTITGRKKEL